VNRVLDLLNLMNFKSHEERCLKTTHARAAFLVAAVTLAFLALPVAIRCQQPSTAKIYRGSAGDKYIEMRLNIQGSNVTGTYSYDSIGEDLTVSGHIDGQGRLELAEFVNKKQTGKFTCKRSLDDPIDQQCAWSKPDGTREMMVTLSEQHIAFTNGFQIIPKTIAERRSGVRVSYPQITNGGKALSPGAQGFNRRVLTLVQKAIKDFSPGPAGRSSFDMNYDVLLAADDLISVQLSADFYSGGAHPDSEFQAVTYDLSGNKELKLEDLFKPDSDYKMAIAKYVVADIDKRADALEQEDATREGRKPKPRDGSIVSIDELSEISNWGVTPAGLVVYFDFAHAIAVFDRNVVPYSVIKDYLKPNSPAARFNKP
jgi:hypothetical protein